jgi:uncharacterized membrane protein YfcA
MPIIDPRFYAAAIPAVAILGISKGGFAPGVGVVAVPLVATAVPPLQAAGILLPILISMDVVSVWSWRREWDRRSIALLLPGGLVGIGLGWLAARMIDENALRLGIGLISLGFVAWQVLRRELSEARRPPRIFGAVAGVVSGFISFLANAGGPPVQMYLLPQRLPRQVFTGTSAILFAAINASKIGPFFQLGQLDPTNLVTSAVLLPLAVAATALGVWLVRRVDDGPFYRLVLVGLSAVGIALVWIGVAGMIG